MKKPILFMAIAMLLSIFSFAQFKLALIGGAHQSSVIEENNQPGWDTLKNTYSARNGAHFGILCDIPLGKKSHVSFQPGVIYENKGRKSLQYFDPLATPNHVVSKSSTEYINYIDVPLNLILKFGNKFKFILGGGPYGSVFYTGKVTTETVTQSSGTNTSTDYNNVIAGDKPGQYAVFNYGLNGLAGFEIGHFMITANYSRGMNDFYKAVNYTGSFKHQVMGATLGIFLGKPHKTVPKEPKIKDSDNDGIPDDKDGCPTEAGTAVTNGCPDKDGDGVADKDDKCPDVAGLKKYNGCPIPDTDKDGINDEEDKCPNVPGLKKYDGCPIPDTDKDGINDEEDKCPTVPGFRRYNGCPVPDTDGDGINDEEDKCPTIKGTKDNYGCPLATPIKKAIVEKVNYAARRIQFKYIKADLLPASYKVLDEVVKILKDNPAINLSIEGHTSNDGIPEANLKLSQERANNVKAYLLSKGIDASRLNAKGFGGTHLLNLGKTEAEKSQNRRVELKLSN